MQLEKSTKEKILSVLIIVLFLGVLFGGMAIIKTCGNTHEVRFYDGEQLIYTQKVKDGETAKEYKPEVEGKTFVRWEFSGGDPFSFSLRITKDISLYAKWE